VKASLPVLTTGKEAFTASIVGSGKFVKATLRNIEFLKVAFTNFDSGFCRTPAVGC